MDVPTNDFENETFIPRSTSLIPIRNRPSSRSIPSSQSIPSAPATPSASSSSLPTGSQKLMETRTDWLCKDSRNHWYRPCAKNFKFIIFCDSFGSKAVSNLDNFPPNSNVISMSGMCLLEYILIISRGSLVQSTSCFSRSSNMLHSGGREFYGKMPASEFEIQPFCDQCKSSCYSDFRGTITIQNTLNSAIKAARTSFLNQNIPHLVKTAYELTSLVAPRAQITFAIPQMPISSLFTESEIQTKAFSEMLFSLSNYHTIGYDHLKSKNSYWHGRDKLHLSNEGNRQYWQKIKQDLERCFL